ncbi:hypothetical protein [Demequina globuliformis]|uniref:hypothetical protein n=1 Tax=Demequina globuliformis TaxID=676202 RepID=UPI0007838310|nr:hypothetical protein [Demequina globuliformis]
MTNQESFKKRVRTRMAATGEKYSAARRALLEKAQPSSSGWVSQPEVSDARVTEATGTGWDAWVARLDAGPGRDATHTEIATWINSNSDIGGWWAQTVTVGYERITGMRLPGQMPDGTFTVSRSRTFSVPPQELRAIIEDDDSRAALLPDLTATRASKAGVKSPRYALADTADASAQQLGRVQFAFDATASGTKLTVMHEKLETFAATDPWKDFWSGWLDALEAELNEG